MPIAMGGAASHNVANALAASLAAWCLGCPVDAIRKAQLHIGRNNADNPGRANLFDFRGAHILVDYAHNPHGMDALSRVAQAIPSRRRLVLMGQAGNRDDDSVRGLARSAWSMRPDRIVLKELDAYRRGRAPGEIPRLMAEELAALGARADAVSIAPDELAAVRESLAWAREGDLLVLTVHSDREAVLDLLRTMGAKEVGGAGALPFQPATDYSSAQAT
jgi:UDP-N-acetylmuramyl tripeptide synthase